jgi:hypothetical protein
MGSGIGDGEETTRYVLNAGTASGMANLATIDAGLNTSLVVNGVPPGQYFVTVRALNHGGASVPSDEVPVTVTPPVPTLHLPVVNGSSVAQSWSVGGLGTTYTLLARTSPAGPVTINAPLGGRTGLTVPGVASGTYYVSVIAQAGGQTSAESNQVVVTVP